MVLISDMQRISAQKVKQFCKDFGRSMGDGWRDDSWRAEEAYTIQTGEHFGRGGEEGTESEGEEVGGVAGTGEDVSWDLKVAVTDLNEYFGLEQLGHQPGHWFGQHAPSTNDGLRSRGSLTSIELRIREQLDKLRAIPGPHIVACAPSVSGHARRVRVWIPCRCLAIS